MVSITVCEQAVQLSDCPINTTSIHAAAISIHIGLVRQYRTSDTNSRGGSAPERNVTPCRLQDFHTEAENWCRIPASKWQCEWGYCLYPVLWPTGIEYCHKTSTRTDQISTRAFFPPPSAFPSTRKLFFVLHLCPLEQYCGLPEEKQLECAQSPLAIPSPARAVLLSRS